MQDVQDPLGNEVGIRLHGLDSITVHNVDGDAVGAADSSGNALKAVIRVILWRGIVPDA